MAAKRAYQETQVILKFEITTIVAPQILKRQISTSIILKSLKKD